MKKTPGKTPHKLGANHKDPAVKTEVHDANFKQSRDICEDRGVRQIKTAAPGHAPKGK